VAKVNPTGTGLVYAGYLGGAGDDYGFAIAVDGAGNAYVTGDTNSTQATFPVTIGPDLTYNGNYDAFVAKVNPAGTGLVYAGYIGGDGNDYGSGGIAVDGAGNAYVTGSTASTQATFPVTVGPDLTHNGGNYDAFVAKANPTGTGLVYAGYIGGAGDDLGSDIAVDGAGNAYVTGVTDSTQASFPVTVGPDLTHNGGNVAFVAKVNPTGTGLVYAGYIGGDSVGAGNGIAVDGAGNAYVTGDTWSTEATFPVTVGPDLTFNGYSDAFVAKVNPAGTGLVYAGYIGGDGNDYGSDIAVDGAGNAYVTGWTGSTEATFPATIGPDLTYNGSYDDAFVAKVNPTGTGLVYAGYIGGADNDFGYAIAVDGAGNAYVTGSTASTQATFPVTVGPDLTHNGGNYDAFVAKVSGALLLPELFLPGGLSQPSSLRPLFDWGNVSGASSYNIQISTSQNFTSLVLNMNVSASAYVPTADLPKGALLFWRVRANGTNGPSAWSRVRHFDSPNPPSVPTLLTPANNATVANGQPTLDWSDSSPGVDHYEAQISTSATFATTLGRGRGGRTAASQYTPEAALGMDTYYWRVRAVNAAGQFSQWSAGRSFSVP
jgi:hypothetical protein